MPGRMSCAPEPRTGHVSPTALADAAVAALLAEATLTPKPGLVDLRDGGAHRDMDWALLCRSARALRPGFLAMAEAGEQGVGEDRLPELRARIGAAGRQAEAAMLAASGGVNTHRGAIWALGLLVTAAAAWPVLPLRALGARAGELARVEDAGAPSPLALPGGRVCARYGVGGARHQAAAGFPQVMDHGLPALQAARRRGAAETPARLDALLAIMRQLDDTCLLARGGRFGLELAQDGAAAVLQAGGCASQEGWRLLLKLDQRLRRRRLSPGGAADLLAATLLLDSLAQTQAREDYEMERYTFTYSATAGPGVRRSLAGVVGSGDLEVLLEPSTSGVSQVMVSTALAGTELIWRRVLERVFAETAWPPVRLEIHDFGANPGVIRLRLAQALEAGRRTGGDDGRC